MEKIGQNRTLQHVLVIVIVLVTRSYLAFNGTQSMYIHVITKIYTCYPSIRSIHVTSAHHLMSCPALSCLMLLSTIAVHRTVNCDSSCSCSSHMLMLLEPAITPRTAACTLLCLTLPVVRPTSSYLASHLLWARRRTRYRYRYRYRIGR